MDKVLFEAALEVLTAELDKATDENIKVRLEEAIEELKRNQEESVDTE